MRLWLCGELARELGVEYHTIRDLIRTWEITPHKVPRSPAGKGLDLEQVIVICRALNRLDVIEHFRSEHELGNQVRPARPHVEEDDRSQCIQLGRSA